MVWTQGDSRWKEEKELMKGNAMWGWGALLIDWATICDMGDEGWRSLDLLISLCEEIWM